MWKLGWGACAVLLPNTTRNGKGACAVLVVMAIALMLPAGALSTVVIKFPMTITFNLSLLFVEVSLFVVGAILFAWGFVWPKIK